MSGLCECVSGFNRYVIALDRAVGNIWQESKSVACVPCAGTRILDFPSFGKAIASYNTRSIRQSLGYEERIITTRRCACWLTR